MKFRKKPIIIEATQWFNVGDHPAVFPYSRQEQLSYGCGWMQTSSGGSVVFPGDWIITGIDGEHYPCKPEIFEAIYEPI